MITQGRKIDVLDHGFVRLADHMGGDLSVVRAARVSYDAAWRAGENEGSDARLIRYLVRNKHTSPLEAVVFQFEVKAPIFVLRQWHRHRTWAYNELSARYRELPEEFYVPDPAVIGAQSKDNKQARDMVPEKKYGVDKNNLNPDGSDHHILASISARRQEEVDRYARDCALAFARYADLLVSGWPRELARMVLPLSTYSHMFAKVDLHNLFHFLGLRLHEHAQYEIRVYAEAMLSLARDVAPVTVAAWEEFRG